MKKLIVGVLLALGVLSAQPASAQGLNWNPFLDPFGIVLGMQAMGQAGHYMRQGMTPQQAQAKVMLEGHAAGMRARAAMTPRAAPGLRAGANALQAGAHGIRPRR